MRRAESLEAAAIRDLENRTLASLDGELAKLVYLASTRDYNTGKYRHEGMARTFTSQAAEEALRRCHERAFRAVAAFSLADLTKEIETYARATGNDFEKVLEAWRLLESYSILIPAGCGVTAKHTFISNVMLALTAQRVAAQHQQDPCVPSAPQLL
jgi:hypothetical protein